MPSQTKPSALIVDDSATARATFSSLMEDDFELMEAANCKQAFAAMRTLGSPAVVLCDYQLEDGVGTEILREVAERHPLAAAMLVTAHGSLELALESINGSLAHRFVQKGVPLSEMKAAIDACLVEHRQRENRLREESAALNETVSALVECICIQEPRVRRLSARLSALIQEPDCMIPINDQRDMRIAALVVYIGMLKVPLDIVRSVFDGHPIGSDEWRQYRAFPDHTIEMIRQFPKLSRAVEILQEAFGQSLQKFDNRSPESETVRVSYQAAWLIERLGCSAASAVLLRDAEHAEGQSLRRSYEWAAAKVKSMSRDDTAGHHVTLERALSRLLPGDVLLEDVFDPKGKLLLARGGKLNRKTIEALRDAMDSMRHPRTLQILRSVEMDSIKHGSPEATN